LLSDSLTRVPPFARYPPNTNTDERRSASNCYEIPPPPPREI
jgi:hypothetical protein